MSGSQNARFGDWWRSPTAMAMSQPSGSRSTESVPQSSGSFSMIRQQENSDLVPTSNLSNKRKREETECPLLTSGEMKSMLLTLWKHLECPICYEVGSLPMSMCSNGHLICKSCKTKVNALHSCCSVCQAKMLKIARHLPIENIVKTIPLPCKYEAEGCKSGALYAERTKHERECEYRPFICPRKQCNFSVTANKMLEHVNSSHSGSVLMSLSPKEIPLQNILSSNHIRSVEVNDCQIFHVNDFGLFVVMFHKDDGGLWHTWIQMIANQAKCSLYRYTLKVTNSKTSTSVTYEGNMLSLHCPLMRIIGSGHCLVVSKSIINPEVDNFDSLHAEITVWRYLEEVVKNKCEEIREIVVPEQTSTDIVTVKLENDSDGE